MVLGKTEDKLLFKSGDIDIRTTEKTNLLGVALDSMLKFDDHVLRICRKVSAQINALNRLKNIGTTAEKETLLKSKKSTKGHCDMSVMINMQTISISWKG